MSSLHHSSSQAADPGAGPLPGGAHHSARLPLLQDHEFLDFAARVTRWLLIITELYNNSSLSNYEPSLQPT